MDICGLFEDDFIDVLSEDDSDDATTVVNSPTSRRNGQSGVAKRLDSGLNIYSRSMAAHTPDCSASSNASGGWWTKRLQAKWGTELGLIRCGRDTGSVQQPLGPFELTNKEVSSGAKAPKRICVFSLSDRPWLYKITHARMREYCELQGYTFESRHRFGLAYALYVYLSF
jgi:hypothetical protein